MKKLISIMCTIAMCLSIAATLTGCGGDGNKKPSAKADCKNCLITLDINPSVEIITDEAGKIKAVTGLNNDAKLLLIDLDLKGKTVEEAMKILLDEAKKTGYIFEGADKNAVLVSVATDEKADKDKAEVVLRDSVKAFVDESKANIDLITADSAADPKLTAAAEALGVTVSKYKVIVLAQKYDGTLTAEAAKALSITELNNIIFTAREKRAEILSDEIEKEFDALEDKNEAAEDLKFVELTAKEIENATGEKLKAIIKDNAKADVVKLYKDYYTELLAATNSDPTEGEAYVLDATVKADLEAKILEFNAKKDSMKEVQAKIKALDKTSETYEADRKALKEEFKTAAKAKDKLEDEIEDIVETIEDEVEEKIESGTITSVNIVLAEGCNWDFDIDTEDIAEAKFEAVEEKYEEAFEELGIDIEELEELFEDEVEKAMESMESENDKKLDAFLQTKQAELDALKTALKAEKAALKELNK